MPEPLAIPDDYSGPVDVELTLRYTVGPDDRNPLEDILQAAMRAGLAPEGSVGLQFEQRGDRWACKVDAPFVIT